MTVSPDEARHFTRRCDALLVNLGTLDDGRRQAMRESLDEARSLLLPVLLDPVKCDLSAPRLQFARSILADGVTMLKANAGEADALGEIAVPLAITTGPVDRLRGNEGREVLVSNGDPLMDRTVAMGCALGGLVAALAARSASPFDAALGGLVWFGVCGQIAALGADGPGSFVVRFLDALHSVSIDTLRYEARLS